MPIRVFFSHTHADAGLVDALVKFTKDVFAADVAPSYSSSPHFDSGVPAGGEWLGWIKEQVSESQYTVVVLTAESINKPWVLWETGAVTGVSLAKEDSGTVIVPVMFGIQFDQIPQPLQSLHAIYGDRGSVKGLFNKLNESIGKYEQPQLDALFDSFFGRYMERVKKRLKDRPLPLDEPTINEWLVRLRELEARGRSAEVEHYHRAMLLAFTNKPQHDDEPARDEVLLDIRIHRVLGEMYLASNRPEAAAKQLAKASKLAHERDLFLLHKLGLAYLQANHLEDAEKVLGTIAGLDPEAERTNPEIAGLVGRLHRERWERTKVRKDLERARDAYRAGLEATQNVGYGSPFLADNVGQLSSLLGEIDTAREAFGTVIDIVEQRGARSVWAFASFASACLALGDEEAGFDAIAKLRALGPTTRELDSIRRGFERIREGMGIPAEAYERWLARLLGKRDPG